MAAPVSIVDIRISWPGQSTKETCLFNYKTLSALPLKQENPATACVRAGQFIGFVAFIALVAGGGLAVWVAAFVNLGIRVAQLDRDVSDLLHSELNSLSEVVGRSLRACR